MNRYEEYNYNNLQNNLNTTIVSYESERIKAQKSGDTEKALFYEKKRQEIEEIRDKIAENELLDEDSILKIKDLYEKERSKDESFTKMIKILILTTIVVTIIGVCITNDIEKAILFGAIYLIIAYPIAKLLVKIKNYSNYKEESKDINDPIQKN